MSARRRLLFGLTLAAVLTACALTWVSVRLRYWHEHGWAGVETMPGRQQPTAKRPGTIGSVGWSPGQVIVVMPGQPAARAGIRPRDQVLSIGGVPMRDEAGLRALDARVRAGDVVRYRIRRGDAERDVDVRFESPLRQRSMIVLDVVTFVVADAFLAIAILVFARRPDDRRATVFFAMAVVGALSMLSSISTGLDASMSRGIIYGFHPGMLIAVSAAGVIALAFLPLTLHLSLVFPKDRPVVLRHPYVIRWVYAIPAVAVALGAMFGVVALAVQNLESRSGAQSIGRSFFLGGATLAVAGLLLALFVVRKGRKEGMRNAFASRPLESLFVFFAVCCGAAVILRAVGLKAGSIFFIIGGAGLLALLVLLYPVFSVVQLYRSYRDANVEEKRQVRWPLWGTIIPLGVRIVVTVLTAAASFYWGFHPDEAHDFIAALNVIDVVPRLLYLLIPLSFAFAILKYRLMNIDLIITRTVVYVILSGAVVLLYLVLVGGLGTLLVRMAGVKSQTLVIASTLVVAAIFVPLRNSLQRLVERNLFREAVDYPQALRTIGTLTLTATDLTTFIGGVAEAIQQALQNRAVVIFLRRQEDFVATAKVGVSDKLVGALRVPADAAVGDALDRPFDPTRRAIPETLAAVLRRIEATLVVPVRSHGRLLGFLALARKLSDQEYDLEAIEFLSSAADQIAIAAERIRLQRDEIDFEQAREMQQALLPRAIPQIAGFEISGTWQPARTVGGDYFDVLPLGPATVAVTIGDVVGKGMPAALLMSALQAAVRASASAEIGATELCDRVRRVVAPSLTGGKFITFFYAAIDGTARRVRFCNAGHNPPLLVRADGRTESLAAGGPVLSRVFSDRYEGGETTLESGDRLVLFTDGATEAWDGEGELFGEERLEELVIANRHLSAAELQNTLVQAVTAFAGEPEDDLTLVVVAAV